jgi:biotin synthase
MMTLSHTARYNWTEAEIEELYTLPLNDLLYQAHQIFRANFDPNRIQISSLLSVKTGGCSEDCKYCAQSARYDTELERETLLDVATVVEEAKKAKQKGSDRFCMGAAWRSPKKQHMSVLTEMVREVKKLGMETCLTLGMLSEEQAAELKDAGLDYYNHNLDTSEGYYHEVVTTRTYQDRLDTLSHVSDAGIKVCAGGIIGMGENRTDRISLIATLANLNPHPDSVPINRLVPIPGTPFEQAADIDDIEYVRMVATTRIVMPQSIVRLAAGRETMSDSVQALCFFAGANSVFSGDELLTTPNAGAVRDQNLFDRLSLNTGG